MLLIFVRWHESSRVHSHLTFAQWRGLMLMNEEDGIRLKVTSRNWRLTSLRCQQTFVWKVKFLKSAHIIKGVNLKGDWNWKYSVNFTAVLTSIISAFPSKIFLCGSYVFLNLPRICKNLCDCFRVMGLSVCGCYRFGYHFSFLLFLCNRYLEGLLKATFLDTTLRFCESEVESEFEFPASPPAEAKVDSL